MKKIKRTFVPGAVLLALVLAAAAAHGGLKTSAPVTITPFSDGTGYTATGSLGSARAQNNGVSAIWCEIQAGQGPPSVNMIICHATDASNFQVGCLLGQDDTSHSLTAAVAAMSGDANVYFEVNTGPPGDPNNPPNPSIGICLRLRITNGSQYAPKAP
jgi:hypothetical protein